MLVTQKNGEETIMNLLEIHLSGCKVDESTLSGDSNPDYFEYIDDHLKKIEKWHQILQMIK